MAGLVVTIQQQKKYGKTQQTQVIVHIIDNCQATATQKTTSDFIISSKKRTQHCTAQHLA